MKTQNFSNHRRLVAGWHGITFLAILALLIGSFINLSHSASENLYSASLICLVAIILGFIFAYARLFALKAQDRAIRAEENLRYFAMTGKLLPKELRIGQIIALRFASDDEFVALAQKAAAENLSSKAIKTAIQNWRADHHRV
ncbi:MAG: hypothetical protein EAZ12_06250 [Sphingobacteriia bacterium]|nr:MAG: hypothetical protein EAZ12_06250 [Sphingobacteriia bacterium]